MEWASISENHYQSNLIFVFPKRHIIGLPPRPTLCVCCCCCENEIASAVGAVASPAPLASPPATACGTRWRRNRRRTAT
jgi:hypothetical protein